MFRIKMQQLLVVVLGCAGAFSPPLAQAAEKRPNIVIIMADDLGYGDLTCYNPDSGIQTPNIDRMAAGGMRFTDAHSASTVCTPSRYSILTGQMQFRTGKGAGVFQGVGGPCLITKDRLTLPEMLRQSGYSTACVGKWHVGVTFLDRSGNPVTQGGVKGVQMVDFSRPMADSPLDHGFDRFFGTVCCPGTDWLYAYVDGNRVPVPPTKELDMRTIPQNEFTKDCRQGLIADGFVHSEIDLVFLKKSQEFMEESVRKDPSKPFFLYHATHAVHLPSIPAEQFVGKTKYGPHGDFIVEFDYIVGELFKTLDQLGVADNTLVMLASDNGAEVTAVIEMRAKYNRDPVYPWRGMKRDSWEGGHRTPFIVHWPGKVAPGTTSNQLLSHTDVMATCAAIVGYQLPNNAAEDSYNQLPVLLGTQGDRPVREYLIQQSFHLGFSIRNGDWKYIDHKGSGGNKYATKGRLEKYNVADSEPTAPGQLYDLKNDHCETKNLYFAQAERAQSLKKKLNEFVSTGRSAPQR